MRPGARAAAVLVLLALLGWHLHARAKPEGDRGAADRALLSVTAPVQRLLAGVVDGASGAWSGYFALVGVARQNEALRGDLDRLRAEAAELAELRAENDRLRELAALRARAPGRTLAASVIGRGTSTRFRTLRIDRGTDDGVERGQAVLATAGAVGRVLRATGGYADVLLLVDGLSAAGAVVQSSRLRGVVLGDGGDELHLGFVRRSDSGGVTPGDLLVTTGEDGVFPEGVALGRVIESGAPETGLFLQVLVEPAVDADQVDEVLVVLDRGTGPWSVPVPDPAAGPDPSEGDASAADAEGAGSAP